MALYCSDAEILTIVTPGTQPIIFPAFTALRATSLKSDIALKRDNYCLNMKVQ
jgi:hypothetical protein